MAITITGGKYGAASVSSVGTTTVTVGATPFVSGDFAVARRVDLYNSAGTTFKGMAFVRKWNSTSQLQLETEFFDPKTGAAVTQVVGDTVLVSKNWADVVQAGIAISNNVVTVSDVITLGTAGSVNSLAFHDEDCFVVSTVSTASSHGFTVAGGLTTFGHLQSYANKSWYAGAAFYFSMTIAHVALKASSTAGRFLMFGGSIKGNGSNPLYVGSGYSGNTDYGQLWLLQVQLSNCDVNSPSSWSVPANHVLEDCSYTGTGSSQILVRFRDGVVLGGQYKIPRFSSNPISIFGDDSAGTYALGAPSGNRAVVLDIGNGNVLWRAASNVAQTINCTNLISTDYRMGDGSPQTAGIKNLYFKDDYTNLKDATGLAIIRDSDWTVDSSGTASGSASFVALTAFHSTATGHGTHTSRGPWTYRIRKYGYDEIEGAIAETPYSLGTAGTAFNVEFGGFVNQIARSSLTGTAATALAIAGITVTDHGASPASWNSKQWSITVTVDLATYPTRTAAEVFQHIKAGIAQTATWNGKAGLLWHVLMEEDGAGYVSQRGKSGGAGASLKGVRIIDQAGNPLTGVTYMTADDGTSYVPPTLDVRGLAFTGLVAGSKIKVFDTGTDTELFSVTSSSTSEMWSENISGSVTVDYTIQRAGYLPIRVTGITVTGAVSGGVVSTPVAQSVARWYQASSGLTINTNCYANASTKKWGLTTTSTLQNFASYLLEQWIALGDTGEAYANKPFPIEANGPNSFTWLDGWEADLATYANSIANLSRDGMRYLNASGVMTASWAALLSAGVPSGLQVRYQQVEGNAPTNAATTGNIDQLIQVYGDAAHGNFDYRGFMVCKVQEQGYDQAEVDVVAQYGNLEDQLYVIALNPVANGIAADNPSIASVTITDHGASPVTWNTKAFSVTITDSGTTSGEDIMQAIRYAQDTGGTFQSKNAFNWHDLVQVNGDKFKGVRGAIWGDTGATLKGVRVLRGSDAHPDFTLHTADDGTTVSTTPPAQATATILANSRVQLYNVTTATEISNTFETGTAYAYTVTSGVSVGDTIRLRVCKLGYEGAEAVGTWTATGTPFIVTQTLSAEYAAWGIDGSTVTEYSLDGPNLQIDANDVDGASTKTRLGAFYNYALTTEIGIRQFFGALTFLSTAAIRVNVDVADVFIENTNATTALRFTDLDVRLYKSDGTSIIAPTSYSIHNDYSGVPDVVETGVSGLTGAESAQLMGLTNAPSAAEVWSHSTRTLTSSSGSAPSASENAAAVRAELTTELSRIDAAISSRMATAAYVAPDNAGIAALPTLAEIEASEALAMAADVPTPAENAAAVVAAAEASPLHADTRKVTGQTIYGAGTEADPWRP